MAIYIKHRLMTKKYARCNDLKYRRQSVLIYTNISNIF